ncbi:class I tRNA ligase family protein [Halocella sp. SP3-1]|uniref:class I tRNA ligase family protein n=1 Tax=Halocella sp. SP3-1 TaxID=2382161 RepID=UPI000F763A09|nr:methionine--tRNA ligase [Halocella sp. SP3-1]
MPYGNKELHFGHIGGVFIHADFLARFLRDRIGKENVIFVSGTDCYGSPIVEDYRQSVSDGSFEGSIEDYVRSNHQSQKEALESYYIATNLFAASSIGRAGEIHQQYSYNFIKTLYENGHLKKITTSQFYDPEHEVFLNGRQVVGQCPIDGCQSEKAYADECSLGHQYMEKDLINPKSTLSGKKPEMRAVTNWYFKLEEFQELLREWVEGLKENPGARHFMIKSIEEFLEPPVIYVKNEYLEVLNKIEDKLPDFTLEDDENKSSFELVFDKLEDREKACSILAENAVQFRNGKTLVPFRLTGNIEWGVDAPTLEGLDDLTVWVWPESLWAPISFTQNYLEKENKDKNKWKEWWCSKGAKVYQFIGEDNVYFYGPAEMAMFMGQGDNPSVEPPEGELQLPDLIANNHLLFLDKKASSSGKVKPPMAKDLLDYYTAEQLRAHFLSFGLGIKSVGFKPKPLNPKGGSHGDPVLKEGNLLSNVFNHIVRSCFYTMQKFNDGKLPIGEVSQEVLNEAKEIIFEYEKAVYSYEFHQVMSLMDNYIRGINKYWSKKYKEYKDQDDKSILLQLFIDGFHMLRTATVLMHPVAPKGTEMILEYLNLDEADDFWNWERIFEPVYAFMDNPEEHEFKFLERRVDFFEKHPSQYK